MDSQNRQPFVQSGVGTNTKMKKQEMECKENNEVKTNLVKLQLEQSGEILEVDPAFIEKVVN